MSINISISCIELHRILTLKLFIYNSHFNCRILHKNLLFFVIKGEWPQRVIGVGATLHYSRNPNMLKDHNWQLHPTWKQSQKSVSAQQSSKTFLLFLPFSRLHVRFMAGVSRVAPEASKVVPAHLIFSAVMSCITLVYVCPWREHVNNFTSLISKRWCLYTVETRSLHTLCKKTHYTFFPLTVWS